MGCVSRLLAKPLCKNASASVLGSRLAAISPVCSLSDLGSLRHYYAALPSHRFMILCGVLQVCSFVLGFAAGLVSGPRRSRPRQSRFCACLFEPYGCCISRLAVSLHSPSFIQLEGLGHRLLIRGAFLVRTLPSLADCQTPM